VRVFAGGVGTSLIATGWNDRTILHHARLAEQSSMNNPAYTSAIAQLHATLGGGVDQATAFFERTLNAQAAMLALNDIFWLSSIIFIVIVPLVWLTRPGKGGGGMAGGAH
jgi:DHA2 family multidrug resistance protein